MREADFDGADEGFFQMPDLSIPLRSQLIVDRNTMIHWGSQQTFNIAFFVMRDYACEIWDRNFKKLIGYFGAWKLSVRFDYQLRASDCKNVFRRVHKSLWSLDQDLTRYTEPAHYLLQQGPIFFWYILEVSESYRGGGIGIRCFKAFHDKVMLKSHPSATIFHPFPLQYLKTRADPDKAVQLSASQEKGRDGPTVG